jgi:glycosidase
MKAFYPIVILLILFACTSPNEAPETLNSTENRPIDTNMNTIKRPVIYQMMTRLFSNTNTNNKPWGTLEENGVGKFNAITSKALKALSSSGYTHVWYTGVIEHAVLTDYTKYGIPLDDADVVKGRAGSPYAIKDYFDVNPDLAENVDLRMEEFEALIERTHKNGLKVVIDFVPNHVARGYRSDVKPDNISDFGENDDKSVAFERDNNFYYLPGTAFEVPEGYQSLGEYDYPTKNGRFDEKPAKASGNDVFASQPSIYDWFETVKLNYGVDIQNNRAPHFDPIPDTWHKMQQILSYWAEKGVDGFRCDMAEMVPVEFWHWVTNEINKQYPDIVFIAEIYNPTAYRNYIQTGGFDYLYDKVELYDTLKHIIQNKASTDDLTAIWQRQEGIEKNMLRFLENHDEQRIASPYFAGDALKGIPMMAATAFMHSGPIMMYFGQEFGEPGAGFSGFGGDDGRTTIFDYWGVPEHVKWVNDGNFDGAQLHSSQLELKRSYDQILKMVNNSDALREGGFFDLHYYNRNEQFTGYSDRIYTFLRYKGNDRKLIVINLGEKEEIVNIKIPDIAWQAMDLKSENVLISNELQLIDANISSATKYNEREDIPFRILPYDYQILDIKEKK